VPEPERAGIMKAMLRPLYVHVPVLRAEAHLDRLGALGLGIELLVTGKDLDEARAETLRVARSVKALGFATTVHAPYDVAPAASDRKVREASRARLADALEVADACAAQNVVVHPGFDELRYSTPSEERAAHGHALDTVEALRARLAPSGATLAVENFFATPAALAGFVDQLPSEGLGICLDLGHAHALSRTPLAEWFALLGPRIVQFHLHDNHGGWDEHLAVGDGTVDYAAFYALSAALGRDIPHVIEGRDAEAAEASVWRLRQHGAPQPGG